MGAHELERIRKDSINFPDHKQRLDLRNAYDIDNLKKAREYYMRDLIIDRIDVLRDTGTNLRERNSGIKDDIIDEFCNETGLCRRIGAQYYWAQVKDAESLIPVGQVYAKTLNLNMDLLTKAADNIDCSDMGSSEASQAINAYSGILKNITDAMSKIQLYQTNKERNQVARERTAADSALGMANIQMNLEGSLEDKRTTIKNAFENSKALRDVVNQLRKKNSTTEDDEPEMNVGDFKGEVVEDDYGSE